MPTVTSASVDLSALNWGGAVCSPPSRLWDWVMSTVVALEQLASVKLEGDSARVTSDG